MIKNLSQLKKALAGKPRIEITGHCLPEYVGQVRQVTLANTAAFYSSMYGQPDHKISRANNGLGSQMMWSKAPFWVFRDGICSIFDSDTEHDAQHLIMAFRVLDETSQGAGHQQRPQSSVIADIGEIHQQPLQPLKPLQGIGNPQCHYIKNH